MKSTLKLGAALGVLSLAAGAFAQAAPGNEEGGKSFNDLDSNQDSRVSMIEAQSDQGVRKSFTTADKNADGYISLAEYVSWKNSGMQTTPRSQLNPEVDPVRTPDSGNPAGQ